MEQQQFEFFANEKLEDPEIVDPELELMKDRFAKLLLGEDMSGGGKGVNTAVTISNSITNLYATVFGHNHKLEPLPKEKKAMWRREMDCLLSVCDYMVETQSSLQVLQDGTPIEVMMTQTRSDICVNLPALQKLEAMLIEILDNFQDTEFWYEEQGSRSSKSVSSGSFTRIELRKEEKWWVPVPCVPPGGLSEESRKNLRHKRDCANQIHKAAMSINSSILSEMEIPDSYMTTLPKSGRSSLGDSIYKQMYVPENFSPDYLLDCLNITSEHEALELADKVEASMYTWRRKAGLGHSKSSWDLVKDFMSETDNRSDKNTVLAERAESLLFCLKQRFPKLSQTSLDICKIQCNQDMGKAALESYSRILEGLAFNIVSWIEDVFSTDRSINHETTNINKSN
ncbi:rop guanine nucleotide exchange factor 3-like isoform X4 [Punica granatum]|uniref:Rop guanine nucleotide exchange factor 3-like isoform X4 n=1 Tax=Punica granatum TaxID=22663 RepID=A0A6P8D6N4_PUNGR|nr:rop guanine nucleotide exchange factor 3-like isoform X4 [Punica granatum]